MKRPGRGLTPDEAALWSRVAKTVVPLEGKRQPVASEAAQAGAQAQEGAGTAPAAKAKPRALPPLVPPAACAPAAKAQGARPARTLDQHGLDAGWDRRLAKGTVTPDFTLDLHGSSLDAAHGRLDHGLTQALAQGARVVLLITGRPRPSDDHASRGARRGAIRNKFLDWLTAGPHASRIAAIRPAHPRHGGAGAVYLVLRRAR